MNHCCRAADHPPVLLTPEKPHFFKVILANTICDGKLGIPKEFVRKFGSNLPNQLTLNVLPDVVWKIGLTRSDGVIWLQNGWEEFVDYYSIAHGHFLVFRYEDNSCFSVTIFDTTGSEIDYPYKKKELETQDCEISDNCSKRRQKSQLPNRWPHKTARTNLTAKFDRSRNSQDAVFRRIQSKILKMEPLRSDEKAVCLEMAGEFVSDYPHFRIVMQPSFRRGALNVPADFAREYMDQKKDSVFLLNSDGKTWFANYFTEGVKLNARFYGGWSKFAHDNKLEVGDVCTFELIKGDEIVFRVSTFKFPKNAGDLDQESAGQQCARGRTPGPRKFINKFTSEYPFFGIVIGLIGPSQHNVTAPWKFTKELSKQTAEKELRFARLQVGEKCWRVSFISYPEHKQGKFGSGWPVFTRENFLENGDACLFELINKDDALVKVSIFKNDG